MAVASATMAEVGAPNPIAEARFAVEALTTSVLLSLYLLFHFLV